MPPPPRNWRKEMIAPILGNTVFRMLALPTLAIVALAFLAGQSPAQAAPPAAPGAVTGLTTSKVKTHSLTVTWNAPSATPTAAYIIKLFEASDTSTAVQTADKGPRQTLKVNFHQLKPGTAYVVSVKAQNKNKDGKTAGPERTATATTIAVPSAPGAVTSLNSEVTYHSLTVTWNAPNPAPTGKYLVEIFDVSDGNTRKEVKKNIGKNATKARFKHLKPNTTYKVSVRARNYTEAGGFSAPSPRSLVSRTTNAKTTAPGAVTNLTVSKTTYSSLEVTWTAPSPAPTGNYLVRVFNVDDGVTLTASKGVAKNATKARFDAGLKPDTYYSIRVAARNYTDEGGFSASPWNSVQTSTKALPTAPGAVGNLAFSKVTSNSLTVTWDAPSPAPTNKYLITLFQGSSTTAHKERNARKAHFTGLSTSTTYKVSVKAQNEKYGRAFAGSASELSTTTKATGGRPGAPTNIRFSQPDIASSTYTLKIDWDAPTSNGGLAIDSYNVKVTERVYASRTSTEPTSETVVVQAKKRSSKRTHTYTGAKYGAEYEVEIRAGNSAGKGPWATQASTYIRRGL